MTKGQRPMIKGQGPMTKGQGSTADDQEPIGVLILSAIGHCPIGHVAIKSVILS
jgi:hypothetical protein